jgi:hypothetical protein
MNFVAILISFALPLQVHAFSSNKQLAPPYWAVNTIIDMSILLGLANLRSRSLLYNPNPELFLRELEKFDQLKKRRKQMIENFVHNNYLITTR